MLAGQPRSVAETFPFIKKHLLDPNPGVDVFIHAWYDQDQAGKPFGGTSSALVGAEPNLVAKDIPSLLAELYRPAAMSIEPQQDFSSYETILPRIPRGLVNPIAIFSAWTSRQRCQALIAEHERQHGFKYDYVISTRTDCLLLRDIRVRALEKNFLHIHGHYVRGTFGIVDQLYIASSDQMASIATIRDKVEEYVSVTGLWNAEAQLLHHLAINHIPVLGHHWYPILVRGNGVLPSILKSLRSYASMAIKDALREFPLISLFYNRLRLALRGPYPEHADWIRDRRTGLLERA